MTDIRVRGTSDPSEIVAVLALLRRDPAPAQPSGLIAWRRQRRAALAHRFSGATPGRRPAAS